MNDNKTVHVYYSFYEGMHHHTWKYGTLPSGWWWSGGNGMIDKHPRYTHEEQFSGPNLSHHAMKYFLHKSFEELHRRGIIKYYSLHLPSSMYHYK